jgi:hypothetical protein
MCLPCRIYRPFVCIPLRYLVSILLKSVCSCYLEFANTASLVNSSSHRLCVDSSINVVFDILSVNRSHSDGSNQQAVHKGRLVIQTQIMLRRAVFELETVREMLQSSLNRYSESS